MDVTTSDVHRVSCLYQIIFRRATGLVFGSFSCNMLAAGPVVQLVERLICNEEVSGSSPLGSTFGQIGRVTASRQKSFSWFAKASLNRGAFCVSSTYPR